MREIEFRGKWVINGEWLYGDLMNDSLHGGTYFSKEDGSFEWWRHEVDPDTIGQFTGLKDKKGVKIYEGDVVSFDIETDDEFGGVFIGVVSYISELAGYIIQSESNGYTLNSDVEIIGNIHENKELLKQ